MRVKNLQMPLLLTLVVSWNLLPGAITSTLAQESLEQSTRLLRFPTISQEAVVFTFAGNLYTVGRDGGVARRLTAAVGNEMFARFSPDGKQIAFTGQYDGNTEVYLIPSTGGVPRRLTYTATLNRDDVSDRMGPNNIVMGWTPDGKHILFRSRMQEWNDFIGQLFTVDLEGNLPQQLPLVRGGFASYSADGSQLAFNRVFREFRTWKRYRGGMADEIWLFDFKTKKTQRLTENPAQDIIPMFHHNKVYFTSDRDDYERLNLFVYDLHTSQTKQLTEFKEFDIKFPSIGADAVVFENGGYLYRYDLNNEGGKAVPIPIQIYDDQLNSRPELLTVGDQIRGFDLAPGGKRAVFTARGDLFTVPAKNGPTRNLTNSSGVHDRDPVWSPDGKKIAYWSDATGEFEVSIIDPQGLEAPTTISTGMDTYPYDLVWSPDNTKLLWSDKKLRLRYLEVESKKIVEVDQAERWEIRSYTWSPDSRWIAYERPDLLTQSKLWLYGLADQKRTELTDGFYDSGFPAFSKDGKYLFFVSQRRFKPTYSQTEWNHIYEEMAQIYLVRLGKETPSPFAPESDEVATDEKKAAAAKQEEANPPITVDLADIQSRVEAIPVRPSGYTGLSGVEGGLYYFRATGDGLPTLCFFDLNEKKETELGNFTGYAIGGDYKHMLVAQGNKYGIVALPKAPIALKETLDLSGMETRVDRQDEWLQMFHESWRQMRDFFYDPGMHGVDWTGMRDRYLPLAKSVRHRDDLNYVIGEMVSELNVGHAYVGGGDRPKVERIPLGLLGAKIERDPTGYFKIVKILQEVVWDPPLRSPLVAPGVNAKEGDFIVAINGQPANEIRNLYEQLINKVGKQVQLRLNSEPKEKGSREVVIEPIADESPLYYAEWVERNRRKVAEATDGKIGYLHIPDMLAPGLNQFARYFYPQLRKKGLIIDVRGNGGGNVSPQIIERLRREMAMIDRPRNVAPISDPVELMNGPLVLLCNEFSASDGDLVVYRFKKYKLGTVIGKRTWGGTVGIRSPLPLLDGGQLFKPEFASYDVEGKEWIIEGYGVEPDIFVDNDPHQEFLGEDEQLQKAIAVIQEQLAKTDTELAVPPPYPVKVPPALRKKPESQNPKPATEPKPEQPETK